MYSIYLGEIQKIDEWKLLGDFTKKEHTNLFIIINNEKIQQKWLSELKEYDETINFNWREIEELQKEVANCLDNDKLKDNLILKCIFETQCDFKRENLQLIFSGGN